MVVFLRSFGCRKNLWLLGTHIILGNPHIESKRDLPLSVFVWCELLGWYNMSMWSGWTLSVAWRYNQKSRGRPSIFCKPLYISEFFLLRRINKQNFIVNHQAYLRSFQRCHSLYMTCLTCDKFMILCPWKISTTQVIELWKDRDITPWTLDLQNKNWHDRPKHTSTSLVRIVLYGSGIWTLWPCWRASNRPKCCGFSVCPWGDFGARDVLRDENRYKKPGRSWMEEWKLKDPEFVRQDGSTHQCGSMEAANFALWICRWTIGKFIALNGHGLTNTSGTPIPRMKTFFWKGCGCSYFRVVMILKNQSSDSPIIEKHPTILWSRPHSIHSFRILSHPMIVSISSIKAGAHHPAKMMNFPNELIISRSWSPFQTHVRLIWAESSGSGNWMQDSHLVALTEGPQVLLLFALMMLFCFFC